MLELTAEQVRVLGCLIEKALTTPDQYPLTTNSLVLACNQKTNREPVVEYGERIVDQAMLELRQLGLARTVTGGGRTNKHRHVVGEAFGLGDAEVAVLGVLLLRGAQTPGELRTRTGRSHGFDSLDEVEAALDRLAQRDEPLVLHLDRQPGQKEARWAHMLGGEAAALAQAAVGPGAAWGGAGSGGGGGPASSGRRAVPDEVAELGSRLAAMEERLATTEAQVGRLYRLLGEDADE
jgi:uncharacterized protein YceH (UPF0502 family)